MGKQVNIGLIGAGRIGRIHARNLKFQVPGAKLVAVADVIVVSAKELAKELEIPICEQDYHRLLDHEEIEAIVICSSTDTMHRSSLNQQKLENMSFAKNQLL
jgi:myo-inositol 2-dehydrogenase/D-chiro-inositol 1-dehydrogenase